MEEGYFERSRVAATTTTPLSRPSSSSLCVCLPSPFCCKQSSILVVGYRHGILRFFQDSLPLLFGVPECTRYVLYCCWTDATVPVWYSYYSLSTTVRILETMLFREHPVHRLRSPILVCTNESGDHVRNHARLVRI